MLWHLEWHIQQPTDKQTQILKTWEIALLTPPFVDAPARRPMIGVPHWQKNAVFVLLLRVKVTLSMINDEAKCLCCMLAMSAIKSDSCGELFLAAPSVVKVRVRFGDNSTCLGDVSNTDDVTCAVQSRLVFKLSGCVNNDIGNRAFWRLFCKSNATCFSFPSDERVGILLHLRLNTCFCWHKHNILTVHKFDYTTPQRNLELHIMCRIETQIGNSQFPHPPPSPHYDYCNM